MITPYYINTLSSLSPSRVQVLCIWNLAVEAISRTVRAPSCVRLRAEQVHDGQQRVKEAHREHERHQHRAQVDQHRTARHKSQNKQASRVDVLANHHLHRNFAHEHTHSTLTNTLIAHKKITCTTSSSRSSRNGVTRLRLSIGPRGPWATPARRKEKKKK